MPVYFKGRVAPPNLDHLRHLSHIRHSQHLKVLKTVTPPATWDSRTQGWVGPVKNQSSCGSCHSNDTEVLTEKGWILWPEYDWKIPLGTMSLTSGLLEFQPPLVKHIYEYNGPMYYSDHRSLDFGLTPNHKMVWSRNGEHWKKLSIVDLPNYVDIPHSTEGWIGIELGKLCIGGRFYDGDDFLALIAIIISDGHVGHYYDSNGGQNKITFSCFNSNRQEEVRALAYKLGIPEQESRRGVWYFTDEILAEWFRQNAYIAGGYTAAFKHVPIIVKCVSERQIKHFLNFFGDQHTQAYGGRRFYSCSSSMMDDLQELCLRIGKRATIEESPARKEIMNSGVLIKGNYPEFMLTERKRDSLCLQKEHTQIEHYKGEVYCATVLNGTLVTRRNKKILISSNCWDFSGTGVVEIAYNKAGVGGGIDKFILSEQYILSCGSNGGCNGDDNTNVLAWAKATGLPLTNDYGPYTAQSSQCAYSSSMKLYKINDWGFADSNGGGGITPTPDIKAAIMEYGCVGCGVAADSQFSAYTSGVFQDDGNQSIDHDVILIGWDDSKGAFLLRNSWSPSWGDQGYMWIAYGANMVGSESVFAIVTNPNPPVPTPTPDVPTPIF